VVARDEKGQWVNLNPQAKQRRSNMLTFELATTRPEPHLRPGSGPLEPVLVEHIAGRKNQAFMNSEWWSRPMSPNMDFFFGVALFVAVLASLYSGKTRAKYQGWVYRAKEPGTYWFCIVAYLLLSFFFIWLFWSSPLPAASN
jgi:hypothetical protein